MTERARGTVVAAFAAAMFGSSYVATAFQLHGFTPLGGALWRSGFASVVLVALSGWMVVRRRILPDGARPSPPPMAGTAWFACSSSASSASCSSSA